MNYDILNQEIDKAIAKIDLEIGRWTYMLGIKGCSEDAKKRIGSMNIVKDSLMTRYRY